MSSKSRGKPKVFISHGRSDTVLPYGNSANGLVPRFRGDGYSVDFVPFDGGHEVPGEISARAMDWLSADYR